MPVHIVRANQNGMVCPSLQTQQRATAACPKGKAPDLHKLSKLQLHLRVATPSNATSGRQSAEFERERV
jgi:hypothetical protein